MSNNSKAMIATPIDVLGTQLERYGQRDVVRELMSRLLMLHPSADEVGEGGMLAVAQLAVLVGANPLPSTNEIHVWKDKKGNIVIDLGINYFRRRGNELGGLYWVEQPRMMTETEYDTYGLNAGSQIGAICKAARLDKIRELMAMGIPFEGALQGLVRTGVGTVSKGGYAKEGRPLSWTALKASEKDLHRALFPNLEQPRTDWLDVVPEEPSDAHWPGYTIDGTTPVEIEALARAQAAQARHDQEWAQMTPEEQQAKAGQNSRILFGDSEFEGFDTDAEPLPDWDDGTFGAGEGDGEDDPDNGDRVQVADVPAFEDGAAVPDEALTYYEAYWEEFAKPPASIKALRTWASKKQGA